MRTYFVQFDKAIRYQCRIEAVTPVEAVEAFWVGYNDDMLNEVEIDAEGPSGLSVTDRHGNPVIVGPAIDLS